MNTPTVSVIIPTHNRADLLPRAIDSVVAQTFDDWEVVLVDDGSRDNTSEIAESYQKRLGNKFRYIYQENAGSSAARNRGIDEACGEFVAFLDSDDEFLPNKLERQLELFLREPSLGLVYSDFSYVDLGGKRHKSIFDNVAPIARTVPHTEITPGLCVCTGDLLDTMIHGYIIATIVGMVRRNVLGSAIRFPINLAYSEEWLFYLKVAKECRAGFVDEPLCLHHHVLGSLARTDPHRNSLGMRDLLRRMLIDLAPLKKRHLRVVKANLANAGAQVGYDQYKAGQHREAALSFLESFRHRPQTCTLKAMLQATMKALLHRPARATC